MLLEELQGKYIMYSYVSISIRLYY